MDPREHTPESVILLLLADHGFSTEEQALVFGLPPSSVGRAEEFIKKLKYTASNGQEHHETAMLTLEILTAASELYGEERGVREWLEKPEPHLSGRTPKQCLTGCDGATLKSHLEFIMGGPIGLRAKLD